MKQKGPFVKGRRFYAADEKAQKLNRKRIRISYNPKKRIPFEAYPTHMTWRVNQHYMDDD